MLRRDANFRPPALLELHVGIDDTDSKQGGCTTYTAAVIFEKLLKKGFIPADFPWLVRLNPNILWKTRGNGALALHFLVEENRLNEAKEVALAEVEKTSKPPIPNTDPVVVFLQGPIPEDLTHFSEAALHEVLRVNDAKILARRTDADCHILKGTRGLVGALAAIGANFQENCTYEIVAYRTREYLGTPRKVESSSVKEMNERSRGETFNNVDPETGRVLICPHGPDPVLFGIRGENPVGLIQAFQWVRVGEPIERVMIFRTNHGTDAHFKIRRKTSELRPHQSTVVAGTVETHPRVLLGGHVVFSLVDETGSVDCAAYEPTGSFNTVVRELLPGDQVIVFGGVRRSPSNLLTLNLEKLEVVNLVQAIRYLNPSCKKCNRRCESMGRGQGFRCRKCGLRFPREALETVVQNRRIEEKTYIPPPRANRHLTKPMSRYERTGNPQTLALCLGVSRSHFS